MCNFVEQQIKIQKYMSRYVRKLEEVRAVRAENNLEEIRELAQVPVSYYPKIGAPFYEVNGVCRVLYVGYWLVRQEDGSLEVMDNKEFNRIYEPK